MKLSWADSRIRMWFSDLSGTDSVSNFRVCYFTAVRMQILNLTYIPSTRGIFTFMHP